MTIRSIFIALIALASISSVSALEENPRAIRNSAQGTETIASRHLDEDPYNDDDDYYVDDDDEEEDDYYSNDNAEDGEEVEDDYFEDDESGEFCFSTERGFFMIYLSTLLLESHGLALHKFLNICGSNFIHY